MNLNELKEIVDEQIEAGNGALVVIAGDCNKLHKVYATDPVLIEDLDEHYLEEIAEEDNNGYPYNAFVLAI
jgi:hypothetical protein